MGLDKGKELHHICIIGAGFSGLCAAVQIQRQLGVDNFTILERNEDFGGVWWSNKYPGCASDIFSHFYRLSFEPNPNWSSSYAPQSEILAYIRNIAAKHGLYKNALFGRTVESVVWQEGRSQWEVTVLNTNSKQREVLVFDVVINAQGRFNLPKVPEKFLAFKHPVIHSAMWNHNIPLEGKTVAVVGVGSTGVQIIPSLAPIVKTLYVYIRNPPYIVPATPVVYSWFKKWCFRFLPFVQWIYRCYLYYQHEKYFSFFIKDSVFNQGGKGFCQSYMQEVIKDEELRRKLTPGYEFLCKRLIPSRDFYPALARDNVEVINSPIISVQENSLVTEDGKTQDVDVLVLATGFHVQDTYGSFRLIGTKGVDVHKTWVEDKPSAYLAIMTAIAPNYFILLGPNSAPGYTSVLFSLECQVNWMIQVLRRMMRNNHKSVRVLPSVEEDYMKELHERMKDKIYTHPSCGVAGSWFSNSKGQVAEIYPGRTFSYWRRTMIANANGLEFK